jgi:hypothetical protein
MLLTSCGKSRLFIQMSLMKCFGMKDSQLGQQADDVY